MRKKEKAVFFNMTPKSLEVISGHGQKYHFGLNKEYRLEEWKNNKIISSFCKGSRDEIIRRLIAAGVVSDTNNTSKMIK